MPPLQHPGKPAVFSQAAILILLETLDIKNAESTKYESWGLVFKATSLTVPEEFSLLP